MKDRTSSKRKGPYQPSAQQDFGASFYTDSDAPVRYKVRRDHGCFRHDLIYVSSYMHDATFQMDHVRRSGRSVIIPLTRMRWERYPLWDEVEKTMSSRLVITQVGEFRLELNEKTGSFFKKPELIISSVYTWRTGTRGSGEEIIIDTCFGDRLRLPIGENSSIVLTDLVAKNLHSIH